jgi:hypothetical protein
MNKVGQTGFRATFNHYTIFIIHNVEAQQLYQKHRNPHFFNLL